MTYMMHQFVLFVCNYVLALTALQMYLLCVLYVHAFNCVYCTNNCEYIVCIWLCNHTFVCTSNICVYAYFGCMLQEMSVI